MRPRPRRPPPTSIISEPMPRPRPGGRPRAATAEPRRPHLPGHDEVGSRAAVHQPGPEPRLRLQPRRGRPRVRRGGAARSALRDGVLGPGARARPQHQRARWRPTTSRRRCELVQKAAPLKARRHPARAGVHRRAGAALHRASRTTGSRPIAPMPTRCARSQRTFPRRSRRRARCSPKR